MRWLAVWSCLCLAACANVPPPPKAQLVRVNKCCHKTEVMFSTGCRLAAEVNRTVWSPAFSDENGRPNNKVQGPFNYSIGLPKCYSRQQFPIYNVPGGADRLALLADGRLRHYFLQTSAAPGPGQQLWDDQVDPTQRFYDYTLGLYCLDKVVQEGEVSEREYALVCNPHVKPEWHETEFLLRRVLDPACHALALCCYLAVAVVHFVLPQMRDLVGNMVATLCVCLAVAQVADTVRIFTEFTSETAFLIAEALLYASLLGAFFWLNSAGYYIWRTFRSRNVFLRITDGRKYCYYSMYVWSCTIGMTLFAVFAHLTLDTSSNDELQEGNTPEDPNGAIGWLGVAVFFTPIACTILIDIFFYASTTNIIKRMSTYGRIHHKMNYSFVTFGKLLLVLTVGWMFLLLAQTPQSGLYYAYIASNALQGLLVLYICVFSQKRVRFLLRKACCYDSCICSCCRPRPEEAPEWGEESMAMNTR